MNRGNFEYINDGIAKHPVNTPDGLQSLATALIAGLRLVAQTPDLLPQFPADLMPPSPAPDSTAA